MSREYTAKILEETYYQSDICEKYRIKERENLVEGTKRGVKDFIVEDER